MTRFSEARDICLNIHRSIWGRKWAESSLIASEGRAGTIGRYERQIRKEGTKGRYLDMYKETWDRLGIRAKEKSILELLSFVQGGCLLST